MYRRKSFVCVCAVALWDAVFLQKVELDWIKVDKTQAFKTVFLGDSNVGKTCLARMIVDRAVLEKSSNTVGFDHHMKQVEVEEGIHVKVREREREGEGERECVCVCVWKGGQYTTCIIVHILGKLSKWETVCHTFSTQCRHIPSTASIVGPLWRQPVNVSGGTGHLIERVCVCVFVWRTLCKLFCGPN